ncbi:MAG: carbohydrate ABC transporter permease [Chloroflexota bacterium]
MTLSRDRSLPLAAAPPRRLGRIAGARLRTLAYHGLLAAACAIILLPLVWMLSSSLKNDNEIFVFPPHLLPAHPLWQNYPAALHYIDFGLYMRNTVVIATGAVCGTVLSCTLTAYAFARLQWRGRNLCFALCMGTLMLPFQVQMIPLYIIFRHLGWIGTFLPLVVPAFFGNALYIFLLRQFLLTIPRELSEAASIDGAGEFGTFWRIILPLVKPALAAIVLFSFLDSWQDFLGPLIYLNDPATFTLSLGLQLYYSVHQTAWAYLMCAAVVFTMPALIVFIAAQRTFVQGITLTGVKG